MSKFIWMSDLHFTHEGDVLGHDPRSRLHAAIEFTNAHHNDAQFCLLTGDLVNRGTDIDYSALNNKLSSLAMPFLPMVGNHDDRSILRARLKVPDSCMDNFIQYSISTDAGLIVCLDTQKTGSDGGEYCDERREWLRNTLQSAEDRSVYIFMHHPPMALGLPMQDTENMENGAAFLDLLSEYDNVKYIFIGHVHRPITGTVRGMPFSTMRSTLYQAPPPKPDWDWDSFKPSEEAPNLGVISIADTSVNLQYVQFAKY